MCTLLAARRRPPLLHPPPRAIKARGTAAQPLRASTDDEEGGNGCSTLSTHAAVASEDLPASVDAFVIRHGRPDLAAMLLQVAQECGAASRAGAGGDELRVGVFVAGPEGVVAAVMHVCASLNGVWGGRAGRAYLHVRAMTHEL